MEPGVKLIQDFAVILIAAAIGAKGARLCGVSAVAGYLLVGILVSSADFFFFDLTDPERLRTLSQIGIVFVMFSIGLNTRISDLKPSGSGPYIAVAITAMIMLLVGRIAGAMIGLGRVESLFFTAMLMISSSVTVNRQLIELGLLHQRAGQMARSHTMLETILAIVLIAALGPFASMETTDASWTQILQEVGKLSAFVVFFFIVGVILLPAILRRASTSSQGDVQTVALTGILFGFSLITVQAGYSLALGAFLTGMITAEIPRSQSIERMFVGIRDVFTAVFFVAAGMTTNLNGMIGSWGLILLGTAIALIGRFVASTVSWTLVCEGERRAAKIAMLVTPTGAFSLLIARLGVENAVLPDSFHAIAVGVVFLTGIFGTLSMRFAEKWDDITPHPSLLRLSRPIQAYRDLWKSIHDLGGIKFLWSFSKPRIAQIAREVLFVTAVILFAHPFIVWSTSEFIPNTIIEPWSQAIPAFLWALAAVAVSPFLVALARNLDAISMVLADFIASTYKSQSHLARVHLTLFRAISFGLFALWLLLLVPWAPLGWKGTVVVLLLTAATTRLAWRRLIRVHSQIESDLKREGYGDPFIRRSFLDTDEWSTNSRTWNLKLREFRLPDFFFCAGRSIEDLNLRNRTGASIVGIDRQGIAITQLNPQLQLFPGDTLFMLGNRGQLDSAVDLLSLENAEPSSPHDLHRSVLDTLEVTHDSGLRDLPLAELPWSRKFGIQILALRRAGEEVINPGPEWRLQDSDHLYLSGTVEAIKSLRSDLRKSQDPANPHLPKHPQLESEAHA